MASNEGTEGTEGTKCSFKFVDNTSCKNYHSNLRLGYTTCDSHVGKHACLTGFSNGTVCLEISSNPVLGGTIWTICDSCKDARKRRNHFNALWRSVSGCRNHFNVCGECDLHSK